MNTDQLRRLLRAISDLAWVPHTNVDQGAGLDPTRDPNLLVALGKISAMADRALEESAASEEPRG
jgi:hypothetical protein